MQELDQRKPNCITLTEYNLQPLMKETNTKQLGFLLFHRLVFPFKLVHKAEIKQLSHMHRLNIAHANQSDQPFEIELLTVTKYYLKNRGFA